MKILIIEDDVTIRNELAYYLSGQGYEVATITEFENVVVQVQQIVPELILLDINLPGHDGHFLCKEIRKVAQMPIIIVTSQNTQLDELMSMNLGADDFISKPYHLQILLARIEAVLKRSYSQLSINKLSYNGLSLDLSNWTIGFEGKEEILSKNEFKILHYLVQNKGKVVSREELMENLWSSEIFIDDNTLSVNMTRLRKKIEQMGMENPIETRRGLGYYMP